MPIFDKTERRVPRKQPFLTLLDSGERMSLPPLSIIGEGINCNLPIARRRVVPKVILYSFFAPPRSQHLYLGRKRTRPREIVITRHRHERRVGSKITKTRPQPFQRLIEPLELLG